MCLTVAVFRCWLGECRVSGALTVWLSVQVFSCSRADALFTVCESGAAAVRTRPAGAELTYEPRGQTDAPRLTRHLRLAAAALEPATEARLAVLLTDGRTLIWEMAGAGGGRRPLWPRPPARLLLAGLLTPGPATPTVLRMCPPLTTKNWQVSEALQHPSSTPGHTRAIFTGQMSASLTCMLYFIVGRRSCHLLRWFMLWFDVVFAVV